MMPALFTSDVEPAEVGDDLRRTRDHDLFFLRDVERVGAHLDAACRELGAGRVEVGLVQVEQRELRALVRECASDGATDTARAAGDDDDLVVQLHLRISSLVCSSE